MKLEKKRIFIKELPIKVNETDLKTTFTDYGKVSSVEIKNRKNDTTNKRFAYINLEIDSFTLQKCFKDFKQNRWFGEYVELQIAKENFLERLKREREEESANVNKPTTKTVEIETNNTSFIVRNGCTNNNKKKVYKSDSSDESEVEEESTELVIKTNKQKIAENETATTKHKEEETTIEGNNLISDKPEFVIKTNKHKVVENGLEIAENLTKVNETKTEKNNFTSESDNKRLKSLNQMISDYKHQKSLIQASLANIDSKPKNKIIFESEETVNFNKKPSQQRQLLDLDNSEDESYNFEIKKQFEGTKGQKLLELQTKYRNDKRFTLDERFIDDNQNLVEDEDDDETTKQFNILEEILDNGIARKSESDIHRKQGMVKYDPSQPEHAKYEVKSFEENVNKTQKQIAKEKKVEVELPSVSKEVFYKVADNLKDNFQETEGFSLLSTFAKVQEENSDNEDNEEMEDIPEETPPTNNNKFLHERNPFRYDSSDGEMEDLEKPPKKQEQEELRIKEKQKKSWFEPFFFKEDDYRLQEGFDFVKRIASEEDGEFVEIRRNLSKIAKAKIKNNLKKNKPFKRKLGGNRQKQIIRIKKAIKKG